MYKRIKKIETRKTSLEACTVWKLNKQ
jgi:hypothetical protein